MPVAIVPIRSFRLGKMRLSGILDDRGREGLGRQLAEHVVGVIETAAVTPMIVSSDPDVVAWSHDRGVKRIEEPGGGLNAAARAGVDQVAPSERWVVLHSDLPALRSGDVRELFHRLESVPSVVAPSSDGGTSGLGSRHRFEFAYGPGSFHRHLARLVEPEVVVSTGLLLDLDSPDDLAASGDFL